MSANRLKLNTDKTELLWTGSRHSISQLHGHGPSIQLGADTVPACDHVRLLGVIISADLSLDRHVSVVSSAFFYWLRQFRRVRRSLDDESAAILVLNDSIFVPPAAIYSHGFSSIRTAVAPSLWLNQRHGTCSKTICVSRTCKLTVFVVHRRRLFYKEKHITVSTLHWK